MRDRQRRGPRRGPGGRTGSDQPRPWRDADTRPAPERSRPAPYPERPRPTCSELFRTAKPIIGVIHLKPLPGSPGYNGSFLELLDHALSEARAIESGGATGLIVENFGDTPYYPDAVPPETIAAMTRLVTEVRKAVRIPVGVNVLRNDARAGVAVAAATGAGFVRINVHTGVMVTDQGLLSGRAWESVRLREILRSRTLLFADIRVKHGAPLAEFDFVQEAEDLVRRGRADALIITGPTTGRPASLEQVTEIKEAFPDVPVLVGSGVDGDSIESVLRVADGCIVGTWIKFDGRVENNIDPSRVRDLSAVADRMAPRQAVERFAPPAERFAPAPERFEAPPERPEPPVDRPRPYADAVPESSPYQRERPAGGFSRPRPTEPAPFQSSTVEPEGDVEVWQPRPAGPAPRLDAEAPVARQLRHEPAAEPAESDSFPARPMRESRATVDRPARSAGPESNGGATPPAPEPSPESPPVSFGRTLHRKKRR